MWEELGIPPCDDPKTIRRAYAARLKKLDPDRDPAGFTRLREALEWALAEAGDTGQLRPLRPRPPEPDGERNAIDHPLPQPTSAEPQDQGFPIPNEPARTDRAADTAPDLFDIRAPDRALLGELESALGRRDAAAATALYYRAAANGSVPLHAAPPLLDRLFALLVEEPTVDRTIFRELARTSGWDKLVAEPGMTSDVRQRVLARLAAENWYDALLAIAELRSGATRKQAKLPRLVLGRIGRHWMPRVDRAALKSSLDEFRTHEKWLSDRIDTAWVETLEKRWRRGQIAQLAFYVIFLAAMLLNGIYVFISEAIAGTLSLSFEAIAAPFVAATMVWLLKLLIMELRRQLRSPTSSASGSGPPDHPQPSDSGPPDDPEIRLRWLEQQAELAYEAMYDAPARSSLAGSYSDAKEFLYDAIALARRLGHAATAERLSRRLDSIKAVFRSQFSG